MTPRKTFGGSSPLNRRYSALRAMSYNHPGQSLQGTERISMIAFLCGLCVWRHFRPQHANGGRPGRCRHMTGPQRFINWKER
jgi:hypothetical protein